MSTSYRALPSELKPEEKKSSPSRSRAEILAMAVIPQRPDMVLTLPFSQEQKPEERKKLKPKQMRRKAKKLIRQYELSLEAMLTSTSKLKLGALKRNSIFFQTPVAKQYSDIDPYPGALDYSPAKVAVPLERQLPKSTVFFIQTIEPTSVPAPVFAFPSAPRQESLPGSEIEKRRYPQKILC